MEGEIRHADVGGNPRFQRSRSCNGPKFSRGCVTVLYVIARGKMNNFCCVSYPPANAHETVTSFHLARTADDFWRRGVESPVSRWDSIVAKIRHGALWLVESLDSSKICKIGSRCCIPSNDSFQIVHQSLAQQNIPMGNQQLRLYPVLQPVPIIIVHTRPISNQQREVFWTARDKIIFLSHNETKHKALHTTNNEVPTDTDTAILDPYHFGRRIYKHNEEVICSSWASAVR